MRSLFAKVWYRGIWRLAPSRRLHGIRTAVWAAANDPERCFDRVDEALDIIGRFDPDSFQSIRQRFRGIFVFGDERFRSAYWSDDASLCVITSRYLESPTTASEDVAATLVHENMHARLCAAGVSYPDGRRASIEVICAMSQLAFARRLPYHRDLVQRLEQRIDAWSTGGEAPWSNETMWQAKLDHLRDMGTPRWIIKIVDRVGRFARAA